MRQLLELGQMPVAEQKGMQCMEDKKKPTRSLFVESSGVTRHDTFLDYIKSGWYECNMNGY